VFFTHGARIDHADRPYEGFRRHMWRGLIAHSTFGLPIRTLAANSFTPMARITFLERHLNW